MAASHRIVLEQALASARADFDSTMARADLALENFKTEHYQTIAASEAKIAGLESNLEIFDGLEQIRMAAQTRQDIHVAVEAHKDVVKGANAKLAQGFENYTRVCMAAATAMEFAMSAAIAASRSPTSAV
jgi:TolA-binding protein